MVKRWVVLWAAWLAPVRSQECATLQTELDAARAAASVQNAEIEELERKHAAALGAARAEAAEAAAVANERVAAVEARAKAREAECEAREAAAAADAEQALKEFEGDAKAELDNLRASYAEAAESVTGVRASLAKSTVVAAVAAQSAMDLKKRVRLLKRCAIAAGVTACATALVAALALRGSGGGGGVPAAVAATGE
jgi:hypothetical protein